MRDALTGPPKTEYNFTGQRLDESTGLLYYGARYYDPALRRWVQARRASSSATASMMAGVPARSVWPRRATSRTW
ncbi:MAG: hypothetical protein H5T59_02220 [Anaerolineae bacterium]|nr:hypothetical protein [Anaerolineae bacterium]